MADSPLMYGGASSRSHCIGAAIVTALLTCLAAGCMPYGRVALGAHLGFMPAFGALSLFVDSLTAGLLLVQARLSGRRSALRLGMAYLFAASITLPHLLAFPGILAAEPVIGGSGSAVWLWCAWHGGFALYVIRFVLATDGTLQPGDILRGVGWTGLAVLCLAVAATAGLPWLPELLDGGSYGRLTATGLGPAILGATVLATLLVAVRLRCRTVTALWLSVALVAASFDVALTLLGGGRFSVGWYAARLQNLMTGVCVLFALLSELMREARRVADANQQLERMVRTDVLTGLFNRRAFELALSSEWRRAQREQTPLSLLMIDIDCFKGFNDRYGHPAGDGCLREVGKVLSGQTYRPADLAARMGGEEFALILPVTEECGAIQVAERLRSSVASLLLPHSGNATGYVTVSIGTATVRPFGLSGDVGRIVDDADHALYRAKAAGRNTVRTSSTPALVPATV